MTLLGDLQAAEPVTVSPPVLDTWVRQTQSEYEALLQDLPPKRVLAAYHRNLPWNNNVSRNEITYDLDPLYLDIPELSLSFTTPSSGVFWVCMKAGILLVRNAIMHLSFVDGRDDVFYEQILGINLVSYGSIPYFGSDIASGGNALLDNAVLHFLCEYEPNAQLDLLPVLRTSEHSPDPNFTVTSTLLSYTVYGGDFIYAETAE